MPDFDVRFLFGFVLTPLPLWLASFHGSTGFVHFSQDSAVQRQYEEQRVPSAFSAILRLLSLRNEAPRAAPQRGCGRRSGILQVDDPYSSGLVGVLVWGRGSKVSNMLFICAYL